MKGCVLSQELRTARIEARIAPDVLAVVKRAAELQGRSLSDFVAAAARDAATRAIEDVQIIRLSIEDQRLFADNLVAPAPPNDALRRAARAYRQLVSDPR